MNNLPWSERVNMLSINPDAATRDDVARMAADISDHLQTIEGLRGEVERLQQWVNDLQSGMYINCVYCGHRYGPDPGTPVAMADILKAHIEQCPKHPLSQMKSRAEAAEAKLSEAERERDDLASELALNASMLAEQCDLARVAEMEWMRFKKLWVESESKFHHVGGQKMLDRLNYLNEVDAALTRQLDEARSFIKKLYDVRSEPDKMLCMVERYQAALSDRATNKLPNRVIGLDSFNPETGKGIFEPDRATGGGEE